MDDLTLEIAIGDLPRLLGILESFERYGLIPNWGKCEVIGSDADSLREVQARFPRFGAFRPTTNWELLGSPIGDAEAIDAAIARVCARTQGMCDVITDGIISSSVAFNLLHTCCGFPVAGLSMRSCGLAARWHQFDAIVRSTFEKLSGGGCDEMAWAQQTLPLRLGGGGLRSAALHAPIAFTASVYGCRDLLPTMLPRFADQPGDQPQPADSLARANSVSSSLRTLPQPAEVGAQKRLSQEFELTRRSGLQDSLPNLHHVARLQSTTQPNTGRWMLVPGGLTNAEFAIMQRWRLGLALFAGNPICPGCRLPCDRYGVHIMLCMAGGLKGIVSSAVEMVLFTIAMEALVNPTRQPSPYGPPYTGLRPDLLFPFFWRGKDVLIDVAVICPLREELLPAAVANPAGGATKYEDIKVAKYAAATASIQAIFVPCIFDCYGGVSESAERLIRSLGYFWGIHNGYSPSIAIPMVFARIELALMKASLRSSCGAPPAPTNNRTLQPGQSVSREEQRAHRILDRGSLS